ncbi:MAG TPA: ABC transporter permease [Bryobacteraceae bacterium]|nr:ABC transporter permease [Bryobacteraceae bacterium]
MTRLRVFLSRLAGLVRKRTRESDIDDELNFHLQMEIAENLRQGMPPSEARSEAQRRLGGTARIKETYRETHALPVIEIFWQDIRFGFRMLRRSPGFSILAILCLTLGIGATTAVFSWIEGILLRPFPLVVHQERMMAITGTDRATPGHDDVSFPDFLDFQKNCTLFDAFIVDRITGTTLAIGDRADRTTMSVVSANYFDALGVRPVLGRGFEPAEDFGRNAHPVTVISYQMWQERFHGDPAIIGKTQMLNGMPHSIIGVTPQGFYGTFVGWAMQLWVPASMQETFDPGGYKLEDRAARWIEGFARLKPGVTPDQAQAEISAVAKRLETAYPAANRGRGIKLYPLWQTPFNNAGTLLPTLSIALAVVVFVLLIACANVSNLLLVRAFGRRHEMTVRLAVGAGRGRLLKQLLTEGFILTMLAAAGGLLVANWCRNLLVLLLPARGGVSMFLPGDLDWRVLVLSAGVCLISTLLFGLVPAIQSSKIDLASALKAESGGVVGGKRRALVRSGLVVVQVALSFVLLAGAGLLLQSLRAVQNTSPGFLTKGVLSSYVDLVAAGYDRQRIKNFDDALVDHLQAVSGVQSVAISRMTPFSYRSYSTAPIAVDGYETPPDEQPTVEFNEVGPTYFATMGIPLVAGREFTPADNETGPPVAVVNEAMASQFWRGRDPVGSRVQVKGHWLQVVGVAKMSKYRNLTELPRPFFYVPMRQSSMGVNIQIRTPLGPETMTKVLVREIHAIDTNLAPGEVITMQEQVDRTTATQRIAVSMLGVFGGLALLLAAIGLYGVMSYTVSQSTRELGLRMALGASVPNLLRLVMSQGLVLTGFGVVFGGVTALAMAKLIANLLYKVSPRDPAAFESALLVMTIASVAACFLPAWRATRTDPVRALRD